MITREESGLNDDTSSSEDNSVTGINSPSDKKRQIAGWVNEGMGLSDIQKKINDDLV